MHNRQSLTTLKAIALLLSLFAADSFAMQMGEMNSHSQLGEPLNATIGLWLSPRDKAQPIRLKISPDIAYRGDSRMTEIVDAMEARLERSANGTPYVRISTSAPISEPIVAFRLKVFAGDNAIMRNFALALDPAPVQPVRRARAARTQPHTIQMPPAVIDGSAYTVARGDTLWGIARRVSGVTGTTTATAAEQIFAANPHAFVNGNQDRLMLGASLKLPGTAATETATPTTESRVSREAGAPATTAPTALEQPSSATQTARTKVRWQERKPEVAAELAALKEKYAALKARYDTQSTPAVTLETGTESTGAAATSVAAPASRPLQANTESPTVTPTAQPITQEPQSDLPTTSASSAAGADQSLTDEGVAMGVDTQVVSIWASSTFQLVVFSILAIIASLLIYAVARRSVVALRARHAELRYYEQEENRKAEVALKAKNRIEMETEVKKMLDERDEADRADVKKDQEVAAANMAALTAGNEEAEAAIDQSIAHGRYAEAEGLLTEVIAATPRNYSAKLRLIEVYYMTERVDEFCQLADDLHHNHRSEMADEEWRRVVRMGKIVAPDRPPFSGPRAVGDSTQTS